MTAIVVTVSRDDTLREAARRMTDQGVGVAVVAGEDGRAGGVITERDVLQSVGRGGDVESERVGDHLAPELIYAYPDWPLDRAAEKMTAGSIRHVAVVDRQGRAIAILSMRDIVRCLVAAGVLEGRPSAPTTA